jgi:hypothetical protein
LGLHHPIRNPIASLKRAHPQATTLAQSLLRSLPPQGPQPYPDVLGSFGRFTFSMPAPHSRQSIQRPESKLPLGSYLTDEVHLFRTVSAPLAGPDQGFVALEDYRTLEVVLFGEEELAGLPIRLVLAAHESSPRNGH